MYLLKRDGKEIFKGTENECYSKLQKIQSQSADWAMIYEGYSVMHKADKRTEKERLDDLGDDISEKYFDIVNEITLCQNKTTKNNLNLAKKELVDMLKNIDEQIRNIK